MKSPKQKSLGQIAYEAYQKSTYGNSGYWITEGRGYRAAWNRVGRELSTAVRARQKGKK